MYGRIGPHKLPSDFILNNFKFPYFDIILSRDDTTRLHQILSRRRNHYYKVDIKHEKLDYCGWTKILFAYHTGSDFHIQFKLEP